MNQTVEQELNNPEMKAKYFSLHIGQTIVGHECDNCSFILTEVSLIDCEVGLWGDWSGGTNPELSCNGMIGIDAAWLNLTPLDQISDEDAIVVANNLGYRSGNNMSMIFDGKKFIKHIQSNKISDYSYDVSHSFTCLDFLRSRGYALKWGEYSVEELIKAGYIKLRKGGGDE